MKTEEKELIVKWLDRFVNNFKHNSITNDIYECVKHFKADNNLLPKPKLVSGWYFSKLKDDSMLYLDFEKDINYGIDYRNEWIKEGGCTAKDMMRVNNISATDEEKLERLSNMAEKIGYVEGVKVEIEHKGSTYHHTLYGEIFISCMGELAMYQNEDKAGYIAIMKDGRWTKIVSTPNRELSTIEQQLLDIKAEVKAFKKRIEKKIEALNKNN